MGRYLVHLLIALTMFLGTPTGALADYVFVPVNFPGAVQTHTAGINNAGHIVGWADFPPPLANSPFTPTAFFTSDQGRTFTTIELPAGSIANQLFGINNVNQVVGTAFGGIGANRNPFVLSPPSNSGNVTEIRVSNGVTRTLTQVFLALGPEGKVGINDLGTVVGSVILRFSPPEPFLGNAGFRAGTGGVVVFEQIGRFPTQVFGINNTNREVGTIELLPGAFRGVFFGPDLADFAVAHVPGCFLGCPTDLFGINNAAEEKNIQLVGRVTAGGHDHGLLVRGEVVSGPINVLANPQIIDIPGASETRLLGINDLGQIVGESSGSPFRGLSLTPFPDDQLSLVRDCFNDPQECQGQLADGLFEAINCDTAEALCNAMRRVTELLLEPNAPDPDSFIVGAVPAAFGVPEPSALLLFASGFGALSLALRTRRRRK